jgi:mono/diheme cytochrome c family protein
MAICRRGLFWAVAMLPLVLPGTSTGQGEMDFDRGRALYENHCQSCHEALAHTREGRSVTTVEGLRARVASWSLHSGLDWSPEEIDEVARFLNRRFYQLTP